MILVFNKTDVQDASFAQDWMEDFEAFQAALQNEETGGAFGGVEGEGANFGGQGSGYMGSLLHSMSLVLEEFYKHLKVVPVSSMTGAGVEDFFKAVQEKKEEFNRDYKPELERRRKQREDEKKGKRDKELGKLLADMNMEDKSKAKRKPRDEEEEPETVSEAEDMSDDDDGMVDPDDDEDFEDDENEDGLKGRYSKALRDEGSKDDGADMSFAKYLASSNVG